LRNDEARSSNHWPAKSFADVAEASEISRRLWQQLKDHVADDWRTNAARSVSSLNFGPAQEQDSFGVFSAIRKLFGEFKKGVL
jgi:hypothetical protein